MRTFLATTIAIALVAAPLGAQRPEPPAVRVAGSGSDTWVLVAGMVGGVAGLGQVESRLVALGYRVVTVDPYHLSLDSADVSFETMARRVAAVMAAHGVRRAHVAGHSHGGGVALRVAALAPGSVASLHLLDVGAMPAQRGRVFGSAIRLVPLITRLPGGRGFVRRRIVAGLRESSARHGWLTADAQRAYTEPLLDRIGAVVAMAVRLDRAAEPEPVAAVLARVQAPVHVLVGNVATPAGPDSAEIAALSALRVPLVVEHLAGVAHFPHEEAPDEVVRALLRQALPAGQARRAP